jgi:hypothetical protein
MNRFTIVKIMPFTKLARLAAIAGMLVPLFLIRALSGTPEGDAAAAALFRANAALAKTPGQAAAWGALAEATAISAQMEHEKAVAEAGRTQITINNNSDAGGSGVETRHVVEEKLNDGSVYTGGMIKRTDGRCVPHGQGNIQDANGSKYSGGWSYGRYHGTGIYTFPDKINLAGEFRNGQPWNTRGRSVSPSSGAKYDGEWNHENNKGGGTIEWKDGRKYKGEWKVVDRGPDLPDGEGRMSWPDGRTYKGEFKDGKMHGIGKMTCADGKVFNGLWREDTFVGEERQSSADAGGAGQSTTPKSGFLSVTAADESFEVFADAAFVGNTPAKLKLSDGTHVIEVKKTGFTDYKKEIKVSEGSELNLRAVLERN